jgi:predicted nuclease of predicted toxin-antitoxin system
MMKFLADQNVRFRTVLALRKVGYDILHTSEIGLATTEDEFVFNTALADGRTLITFDEGIGDYRELPLPDHHPGVIRLKLYPQRWQWVSARLEHFLQTTNDEELRDKVIILYNDRVRMR